MKKLMVAAMAAVLLVGVGCQNDRDADADVTVRTERTDTMRGADDCAMCEGVQTARADGTCPQCGMKLRTANR
jgi:uncharacterized lipoprotein NlpE involved in copper resistance